MKKDILVIGDAHANPAYPNDRFDWLAKLILDRRPDVVLDIGDFADMASLGLHEVGKMAFEGRRYLADVECAIDARKRITEPIKELSARLAAGHRTRYEPRLVALGGNHDHDRFNRTVQNDAKLDGLISVKDLKIEELGWEYHPFGDLVEIQGILFTHFFMGGVMGKPMGGLYPTANILKRYHSSCVQGHTHYFQMRHEMGAHGKLYAFMAGCYFDYDPDWTNAHIFYDRGILILRGVENGTIDGWEWIGINEMKERYAVHTD